MWISLDSHGITPYLFTNTSSLCEVKVECKKNFSKKGGKKWG
jgi:hypothetical protein